MVYLHLACNECGRTFPQPQKGGNHAFILLRHHAKKEGWYHKDHSAIDLCPQCKPKPPAPEEAP